MTASDDRDPQIEAALRTMAVPPARAGFWAELEDSLESGDRPAARRVRRRLPHAPLLAAAAVAVAALVAGAVALQAPEEAGVTTGTTAASPGSSTTTTATAPGDTRWARAAFGEPVDLGSGHVVGVSDDGAAVFAITDDPGASGCEGGPRQRLSAFPIDPSEPFYAVSAESAAETVPNDMVAGPGPVVVLVEQCEGFVEGVAVGRDAGRGRIDQVVDLPDVQDLNAASLSISPDGRRLLGAVSGLADPAQQAVSIDLATGERTVLDATGASWVGELTGGTLVVATGDGIFVGPHRVADHDGTYGDRLAISPDGSEVAIAAGGALRIVDAAGNQRTLVQSDASHDGWYGLAWAPAGDAVLVVAGSQQRPDTMLLAVPAGGGAAAGLADTVTRGPVAVSGSGDVVAYGTPAETGARATALLRS